MRFVPMIDASGMYGIEEFYNQCKKNGIILFLSGVHGQTKQDLKKFGLIESIGEQKFFPNIDAALATAVKIIPDKL
jgi:SulP family sulfate permease